LTDHRDFYRGRKVLVTGGLGFIGSNLCRALADLDARVTAVDSLLPDYGGNLFNLQGYEDRVRINIADVRGNGMEFLVRGHDVLFNLAGQVSHIDSMTDPVTDLEINCTSQLRLLEAVRRGNPDLKVVYAGTRQVYGKPMYLPVDEKHLLQPVDVNGINKISGEFYHLVYQQVYGIRASSLRLTNTYGPRQLIRHNRQGFSAGSSARPPSARRSRSSATDSRSATSTTSTTSWTPSCAPAPWTRPTARPSTSGTIRRCRWPTS
jgi:UDP-glucose 4-epimerase